MLLLPVDSIGRQKRYRKNRPRGRYIRKSPELIRLLAFLHRHGPLPTRFLFDFHGTSSDKMFAGYLARLYDGCCAKYDEHYLDDQGNDITATANPKHTHTVVQRYLNRPNEYRTADLYYAQVVHDLTPDATALLDAHGELSPFVHRTDQPTHRLMGACITASAELVARRNGIDFISRHTILSKLKNNLKLNYLEPDELFGLSTDTVQRFFVCEWDRRSEPIRASSSRRETIEQKLSDYTRFIESRDYQRAWGIKNCRILFATVSETSAANIASLVSGKYPVLKNRIFFRAFPEFAGTDWTIPPKPYAEILTGWTSATGEVFDLIKKTAP